MLISISAPTLTLAGLRDAIYEKTLAAKMSVPQTLVAALVKKMPAYSSVFRYFTGCDYKTACQIVRFAVGPTIVAETVFQFGSVKEARSYESPTFIGRIVVVKVTVGLTLICFMEHSK